MALLVRLLLLFVALLLSGCSDWSRPEHLMHADAEAPPDGVTADFVLDAGAGKDALAGDARQDVVRDTVSDSPLPDKLVPDQKQPFGNGSPCTVGGDCLSGHCVDGVCCSSTCTGTCAACDLTGSIGTCKMVPAGVDPDNECSAAPVASCSFDGTCDGKGACRLYPAGTTCQAGICVNSSTLGNMKTCDGTGTCVNQPNKSCFPYRCNIVSNACYSSCVSAGVCYGYYGCNTSTNQCYSSCSSDSHCKSSGECNSGKCESD